MSRLFLPQWNVLRRRTRKRPAMWTSPKEKFSLFHFVAILATKGFLANHFGFLALQHSLLHTAVIPTTGFGIDTTIRNAYRQFRFGIFFFHLTNEVFFNLNNGGEGGIRTPGTLRHTWFRVRHIRPLCHLSYTGFRPFYFLLLLFCNSFCKTWSTT